MPIFVGSFDEFKTYLNDFVKNKVPALTRKFRQGECELCGKKTTLDSAHLRGREREVIIKEAFEKAAKALGGGIFSVDLDMFAQYIREEHSNPDNFHFLCHACHTKYDAPESSIKESDFKRQGNTGRQITPRRHRERKFFW